MQKNAPEHTENARETHAVPQSRLIEPLGVEGRKLVTQTEGQVHPMIMPLFTSPVSMTGEVPIIKENVTPASFGSAKIFQHGGSFRLCKDGDDGFKLNISWSDALWIIEELKLGVATVSPFRRQAIWSLNP